MTKIKKTSAIIECFPKLKKPQEILLSSPVSPSASSVTFFKSPTLPPKVAIDEITTLEQALSQALADGNIEETTRLIEEVNNLLSRANEKIHDLKLKMNKEVSKKIELERILKDFNPLAPSPSQPKLT